MLGWRSSLDDFRCAPVTEVIRIFEEVDAGSRTRRVAENVLVKRCGRREFLNQDFVWRHLDGPQLRVPKPIRYVEDVDGNGAFLGFLVMEFLHGRTWEEEDDPRYDNDVVQAIYYMHGRGAESVGQHVSPGPIDRRPAEDFPWGNKEVESVFTTMQHLAECASRRLRVHARRRRPRRVHCQQMSTTEDLLELKGQRLSFCHMDLVPRNILILDNEQIAIVDWEMLCLYPVVFELARLFDLERASTDAKVGYLLHSLVSKYEGNENEQNGDTSALWYTSISEARQTLCVPWPKSTPVFGEKMMESCGRDTSHPPSGRPIGWIFTSLRTLLNISSSPVL